MSRSVSGRQPGDAYVPTELIVDVFGEDNRFGSNSCFGRPPHELLADLGAHLPAAARRRHVNLQGVGITWNGG
jgi:hypothetical protein